MAVLGGLAVRPPSAPGFSAAAASIPVVLLTYLRLLCWPLTFSIFRPERPTFGLLDAQVLLSTAILLVLRLAAVGLGRKRPRILLPLAWTLVWLLPVLNVWALDPQWMISDRYLFLPS